ncbi:helix-turn-helix transcriptional regulator [Kocuria sp.]|uniref:helix-turn-helix domain-containing protein n=1 Tax=Kocuria sp. TaxID=1871328 RepID=UPI0026DBC96D|nr:helix-turn-helix transcriptional regulator [Kocuria sp.]MDO4919898.1 helix-turn-helix transcriptional regulator [Kocuria sp.]
MNFQFNPDVLWDIKHQERIETWGELAARLGVNAATLERWRSGKSAPSFAAVSRMVLQFGIPFHRMTLPAEEAAA